MSDTPRTDWAIFDPRDLIETSRHLERELAVCREFIESLVDANGPHTDINGSSVIPHAYQILNQIKS
jgi:hypothetical protein